MADRKFHKITCSDKSYKEMVDDWRSSFPILSQYTPSTLFALYDLMLMGLRISRDRFGGKSYNVELEALPLWNKETPSYPLLHYNVRGEKGLAIWSRFELHDYAFQKNLKSVTENVGEFLSIEVSAAALFAFLDKQYLYPVDMHNPVDVMPLYELKLAFSLYFNDKAVMGAVRRALDMEVRFWDEKHFLGLYKKPIAQWKAEFYHSFDDREAFMAQIHENITNRKVAQLREGHIIWDVTPNDIKVPSRLSLYWWKLRDICR